MSFEDLPTFSNPHGSFLSLTEGKNTTHWRSVIAKDSEVINRRKTLCFQSSLTRNGDVNAVFSAKISTVASQGSLHASIEWLKNVNFERPIPLIEH